MARSVQWRKLYEEAEAWAKLLREYGVTLAKHTDMVLVWNISRELRSIHRSDYRRPIDADIRIALDEARAAVDRLAQLLWERRHRRGN